MKWLWWQIGLVGLMLGMMACGSAEEPTPLPEAAATEEAVVTTAVSSAGTPLSPTSTALPATDTPPAASDDFVPTDTPTTADIKIAATSVTGIDSGIIAFTSINEGADLYALVPGQVPVRMTYAQGLSFGAVWSPSGQRIAYFFLDGVTRSTDIWYFDISEGPDPVAVTNDNEANNIKRLTWSADSEFLAYDAPQADGEESDIYRVAVVSGEIINLTEDASTWDASPAWSPDGERIAFVSDRADEGKASDNIWLMDSEGGQLQQLTNSDATFQDDIEPSWSPDGSQIAFLRHSLLGDSPDPTSPSGLWLVDVATGEEQSLVHITGFLVGVQPPVWSLDGRWLAYNAPGLADTDIWVVPVAGGEPINVGNLPGADATISWAPDSQQLIFTNSEGGTMSQFIVNVDGSALRLLVEGGENGLGNWSP